ncbi:hypothetical protein BY996DRAFT_6412909 [Phakopsora pachyrhizi]|nr:hypothetical protein BY996DRAFT_6412909 [Phakopsora pachyrhizi]
MSSLIENLFVKSFGNVIAFSVLCFKLNPRFCSIYLKALSQNLANCVLPPAVGLEIENNSIVEHAQESDGDLNGTFDILDPELEGHLHCLHKVLVDYSIYVPANGNITSTSTQFGQESNVVNPCIHFCNWGACYKAEFHLSAIGWNQFKFLLHESTNESDAKLYKVIRTTVNPLKKKLSIANNPKTELGVKILTPNPK